MGLVTGSPYVGGGPGSPGGAGGGVGDEPVVSSYSRTHSDQYPNIGGAESFAAMLLGIALRILHPDISRREELMVYGQQPAPGITDTLLRSPGVSPLSIRRMA